MFAYDEQRGFAMPTDEEFEIGQLSLVARIAVALHLFSDYCKRRGLSNLEIDRFIDHLWRFLTVPVSEDFRTWAASEPPLTNTALGFEFPPEFEAFLVDRNVPPNEFRSILANTAEVLYTCMYGAADEPGSRIHLLRLASEVELWGVKMRNLDAVSSSRWADGNGRGEPLSIEDVAKWRDSWF
jgi:hypothetical protein